MDLQNLSNKLRLRIIEMSHKAKAPHLASSLSCIDIITSIYTSILNIKVDEPKWDQRDRFILSKGHAATALYVVLAEIGILNENNLLSYTEKGSLLEEHPNPKLVGIEAATGSLGHGLSIGCGIALSTKIKKEDFKTYVLLSDGECNEGSLWEAALFASAQKLNNLYAIVDYNKWQATGRSNDVLSIGSLVKKFEAFNWNVTEINGHNHNEIIDSLKKNYNNQKPNIVIANTIKGKGISFMEDDNNWHYRIPTKDEVELSKKELGLK